MAQYDVYPNPSESAAQGIPYVVVIQSDLLDALPTRLVVPLAQSPNTIRVPTALCPPVTVKGQTLFALAHYAAPLPARLLKKPIAHLTEEATALVAALDAVLSGV
ncbi:MAG: CcdB family protein [Burkholderiaceae bacterium]|nr:CcdB family protein [Burkholderiaceae bacterium]